jgi:hypothetical protein
VPAVLGGVTALICVPETMLKLAAGTPPKYTATAPAQVRTVDGHAGAAARGPRGGAQAGDDRSAGGGVGEQVAAGGRRRPRRRRHGDIDLPGIAGRGHRGQRRAGVVRHAGRRRGSEQHR